MNEKIKFYETNFLHHLERKFAATEVRLSVIFKV